MARTSPTINKEIFKDRRVQLGAALVGVLAAASAVFFVVGQGAGGDEGVDDTASAVPAPTAPVGAANPAAPDGGPASPAAPGVPLGGAAAAATGPAPSRATSFDNLPPGLGGAAGTPGAPPPPAGGTATATAKPAPIREGQRAPGFRLDPFVSFFRETYTRPRAYTIAPAVRLASYPKPPVPASPTDAEQIYGPLPYVQRRVAGVLYNGSVSAILETGPPGPDTDVRVIQPGALVPSGVPGVDDLTVESINPTQITLRARDGRSVSVKLTNLPAGVADALRGQAGGLGAGDPGGVAPGEGGPPPGGFGRPGGRGGDAGLD